MNVKTWLRNNFGAGVLVLVPVLGTIALFSWLFNEVTGPGFAWVVKRFENDAILKEFLEKNALLFRLVVLILMLGLTVLIGALARNFLGRRIIRLGETFFERIPLINRVYIALKQMSEALWGQKKTAFSDVVAVEFPRKGVYAVGLVTWPGRGEDKAETGDRFINVFLATTPNPTSGWFVMLPEREVIRLNMRVEDAVKMILSGGAVAPDFGEIVRALQARQAEAKEASQAGVGSGEREGGKE